MIVYDPVDGLIAFLILELRKRGYSTDQIRNASVTFIDHPDETHEMSVNLPDPTHPICGTRRSRNWRYRRA